MSLWRLLRSKGRPRQVVVQITNRCNARCAQCGMNVTRPIPRGDMDQETLKRVIDHCAACGVEALSLTGGEPLLAEKALFAGLEHARAAGIRYTRTGTNGFIFAGGDSRDCTDRIDRLGERLAACGLRNFWISLDAADPIIHETNRGLPGMVAGLPRALSVLHGHGIHPTANLALNRFMGGSFPLGAEHPETFYNQCVAALRTFFRFAIELGFTMANCCYPMSDDDRSDGQAAVYAATAAESRVTFSPVEKHMLFRALLDTAPEFRGRLRIFTPLSAVYALARQYGEPPRQGRGCLGGLSFFFVDRHGDTYPCGYRGAENLGPLWELDPARLPDTPTCRACDWECFRDPSEVLGPVADLTGGLRGLGRLLGGDWRQLRLWLADVRYIRACHAFDGRLPPDARRLARFRHS